MNIRPLCVLLCSLILVSAARADFSPELGQAREVIDQGRTAQAQLPANAPELTTYPLPSERPLPLLPELPDKPLRQVSPQPESRAWWKYPFYVVLGLPRDLVDGGFGFVSNWPFFNIPFVYLPYEVLPAQALARDPRDWHHWPGRRNKNGHGMIDSESWGWFPSWHQWHFTYPSQRKLRKNRDWNESVQNELRNRNKELEAANMVIATRQQEARQAALTAIEAGNGREAALRMIPFYQGYKLDEGAFALFVTALAVYQPSAPEWVQSLLWQELKGAQGRYLEQAEKLLLETLAKQPKNQSLAETLIYVRLLLNKNSLALALANAFAASQPDDPRAQRLVFETALAAGQQVAAQNAAKNLHSDNWPQADWALLQSRLRLAAEDPQGAIALLEPLRRAEPENPYPNYYLGAANLMLADRHEQPAANYQRAFELLEQASLQGQHQPIGVRASRALAYARAMAGGIKEKPELFGPAQ